MSVFDFSKQKTAMQGKTAFPSFPYMGDHEEYFETPLPQSLYGRTKDVRSYTDVITKFSRLHGLPIFLTHGASLVRFARWSA